MAIFRYKSIDSNGKVVNQKGVELFILSNMVQDILGEFNNWVSVANNQNKQYPYSDVFTFKIEGMQHLGLDEEAIGIVDSIAVELKRKGLVAADKVAQYGAELILMSDFDEIATYFKEVILQCLDSFEVIDNGNGDTDGSIDTYTKMRMVHGNDEWQYVISEDGDGKTSRNVTINGVESPELDNDAQWVDRLLTTLAIITRKDIVDEWIINKSDGYDLYTKQAKAVASILGGDYKRYLILVASINDPDGLISGLTINKDSAIRLVLDNSLRVSEVQLNEVVKIFSDKPCYH